MERRSTSPAAGSLTPRRCDTPFAGPLITLTLTPGVSADESLGRAHSGAVDARRLHAADAESAAPAPRAHEESRRRDYGDIKHALKNHRLTSIVFEHEPVTIGFAAGAAMIVGAMVLSQL